MEITRETVNQWLDDTRRGREWLADQCGVRISAVGNWLNKKGDARAIPAEHQITIRRLMDEDAAAQSAKPPHALLLEFGDADYSAIEGAALSARQTIREWARDTLIDAAQMDVAAVAAKLGEVLAGPVAVPVKAIEENQAAS